jgi:hypothetical protein
MLWDHYSIQGHGIPIRKRRLYCYKNTIKANKLLTWKKKTINDKIKTTLHTPYSKNESIKKSWNK